ncbi:MAG: S-adenosylmethionine:tRNA ribosyltransferase-isomerase [Oscillospiraceae bacterium]
MKKQDFYFSLPKELIAQTPIEHRDHSRLMILNKTEKTIEHKHFYDIINLLNPGDTLVLNNSKVIPARIFGVKEDTNGVVEFLLLNQKKNDFGKF